MTLNEIEWTSTCCGDACLYAEIAVRDGFLQVKTSHDDNDLAYQVRRYGRDKMPLDAGYVRVSERQFADMLSAAVRE